MALADIRMSTASLRVRDVTLSVTDDPQTYREKLARIVLDEMYQFVGLLDADGMTLEINRAALEGTGIEMDIKGKPFWETRWWAVFQRDPGTPARPRSTGCPGRVYSLRHGDLRQERP